MIHIEHSNNNNNDTNLNHNFHYASEANLSDINNNRYPIGCELQTNGRQTPSMTQEATYSQFQQSHYDYGKYTF